MAAKQYFYEGRPIEDLSKEELIAALKCISDLYFEKHRNHMAALAWPAAADVVSTRVTNGNIPPPALFRFSRD